MNESSDDTQFESSKENINKETGTITWDDLVRHFARGVVIRVDGSLDLVDVAHSMATDDANTLQVLLNNGTVARASDDDARGWTKSNPVFWCVVSAPWVLVQERSDST